MLEPNQPAATVRPSDYVSLLRDPINNGSGQPSYDGWEIDHASKMRFYVGGMKWFTGTSGIYNAGLLPTYGERAAETAQDETNWRRMPVSDDNWTSCSEVQFRRVRNVKPLSLPKAILVILACELALADRIRTGRAADASVTAYSVYDHMKIIPACWHIDDFDTDALKRLLVEDSDATAKLRNLADQTKKTFLDHMATGYTVTLGTAKSVKKYLDTNHPGLGVGGVSARAANKLGVRHASEFEHVDAG